MDAVHYYYHGVSGYQLSQKDAAAIVGFYDKLDAARRSNYQWHDIPAVLKLARTGKLEAEEPNPRCKKCGALKQNGKCPVCSKPGQDKFVKNVPFPKGESAVEFTKRVASANHGYKG
jgi:recombinational DNA repair protein RecR